MQKCRAFTLIELVVTIAVVVVVVSILATALAKWRQSAQRTVTMNNLRSITTAVVGYALEQREVAPTLFPSSANQYPFPSPSVYRNDAGSISGYWFDSSYAFHFAITPVLPLDVILAPGWQSQRTIDAERRPDAGDYLLTEALWAPPDFWRDLRGLHTTTLGVQRLTSVRFPSSKGLVVQSRRYLAGAGPGGQSMLGFPGVPMCIAWFDQSVSYADVNTLRPGSIRPFDHWSVGGLPAVPVLRTTGGVEGVDR